MISYQFTIAGLMANRYQQKYKNALILKYIDTEYSLILIYKTQMAATQVLLSDGFSFYCLLSNGQQVPINHW